MLRSSTVFELCEPEPFTVATWMLMSLTMRLCPMLPDPRGTTSVVAIPTPSFDQRASSCRPRLMSCRGEFTSLYAARLCQIARLKPGGTCFHTRERATGLRLRCERTAPYAGTYYIVTRLIRQGRSSSNRHNASANWRRAGSPPPRDRDGLHPLAQEQCRRCSQVP